MFFWRDPLFFFWGTPWGPWAPWAPWAAWAPWAPRGPWPSLTPYFCSARNGTCPPRRALSRAHCLCVIDAISRLYADDAPIFQNTKYREQNSDIRLPDARISRPLLSLKVFHSSTVFQRALFILSRRTDLLDTNRHSLDPYSVSHTGSQFNDMRRFIIPSLARSSAISLGSILLCARTHDKRILTP